ncbi:MAG: flotillin-like FloA family protein [Candidatus Hydrogenedentes bacterium]|nr:flotillin-like FloA family protein [Candidatus Hydrogenedentota bacterium]
MSEPSMFWPGFVFGVLSMLSVQFLLYAAHPWIKAYLSGAHVQLLQIVAMRLRGNPPIRIIDAYVQMTKRGHRISIDVVEATFIAHQENATSVDALVRILEEQLAQQLTPPQPE